MGAVINQLEVGMKMVLSVTKKWMGGGSRYGQGIRSSFCSLREMQKRS